ncbi:hypothetical protein MKX01_019897 [Papaver californicum]|nr:hypothetical protein MKX01_019897 [Papaver californicum]
MSTQRNFQNITEHELRSLVSQVLTHYQQYYSVKAAAAHEDVYIMFAPPWFSSYELTYLWLTGFKPSVAFKILDKSVTQDELPDEQLEALYRSRVETKAAETELNNEMSRVQESWAYVATISKSSIEKSFWRTKIVETLSPVQGVTFLATATQLQVKIRTLGWQRKAARR